MTYPTLDSLTVAIERSGFENQLMDRIDYRDDWARAKERGIPLSNMFAYRIMEDQEIQNGNVIAR
jgi:hypothetical protein